MTTLPQSNVVGAYDAKTRFSELLDRAAAGEEITITKHGTPVARLVPAAKKTTVQQRRQAIENIRKLSQSLSLGGLKIRDLINEGRR
jgi:prevent-host-death family protein